MKNLALTTILKILIVVFAIALLMTITRKATDKDKSIKYPYSTKIFIDDKEKFSLDIENLTYVVQYDLALNLCSNLINESANDPLGYKSEISEKWHYDQKLETLFFKWRKDNKWSNGEPINIKSYWSHLKSLKLSKALHLELLKKYNNWKLKEDIFSLKVPKEDLNKILYELSTPDAAYLYDNTYSITSGPYKIEKISKNGDILLSKNNYYPTENNGPNKVKIINSKHSDTQKIKLLKEGQIDYFDSSFFRTNLTRKEITNNEDDLSLKMSSFQTHVFATINPKIPKNSRNQITKIILESFKEVDKEYSYLYEKANQMLPQGFSGHLKNIPKNNVNSTEVETTNIQSLTISNNFKNNTPSLDYNFKIFETLFKKVGIKLNFVKFDTTNPPDINIWGFKGNQKEESVSWSFLIKDIHTFKLHYKLYSTTNKSSDNTTFQKFLIENNYYIPLFYTASFIFTGKKIKEIKDLDRYNFRKEYKNFILK